MRVFNLTDRDVDFHGLLIPMNGGYRDYPLLSRGQLPERDQRLASAGLLAFDSLPREWAPKVEAPPPAPATVPVKKVEAPAPLKMGLVEMPVLPVEEVKVEETKPETSNWKKRNR